MTKPITILLIDDHAVVRTGYRRLLESTPDMCIVAEAEDGETGYRLWQEHRPDVIILDLNMPSICGLETIRRIISHDPTTHILVFSMLNNVTMIHHALKAGAIGFISKQSGMGEMIHAVRQVSLGKSYIESELATALIESELATALAMYITHKDNYENPIDTLTKREFQILKLIAEGNSNAEIAEKILISSKTVSVHYLNLMRKLKLQNTTQLIRMAINHNIIQE